MRKLNQPGRRSSQNTNVIGDNITTNGLLENGKQFGLSEGLAGPGLMELLYPEVFA